MEKCYAAITNVVVPWKPVVFIHVQVNLFCTSKLEVEIPVEIHPVAFRPLVLPPVLPPHSIVLLQRKHSKKHNHKALEIHFLITLCLVYSYPSGFATGSR